VEKAPTEEEEMDRGKFPLFLFDFVLPFSENSICYWRGFYATGAAGTGKTVIGDRKGGDSGKCG
jgi:hypothetical protein